jgi:hypothetical protein
MNPVTLILVSESPAQIALAKYVETPIFEFSYWLSSETKMFGVNDKFDHP